MENVDHKIIESREKQITYKMSQLNQWLYTESKYIFKIRPKNQSTSTNKSPQNQDISLG